METSSNIPAQLVYPVKIVRAICSLAGPSSFLDDIRTDLHGCGISRAVSDHDTPALFDWLIRILSFQGISDLVASGYMEQHGAVRWADIVEAVSHKPSCPKLGGYWRFYDCQYRKSSFTCSELGHIDACPLTRHPLRNGHLNQMAYSLFFFIRDVADGDFVNWIDRQLDHAETHSINCLDDLRDPLISHLRNVYGVSDKVLAMALSQLLLGVGKRKPRWFKIGATFVAIDTLVHNFLHRTGILHRLCADHPYGARCYGPGGCASIVSLIATHIDARLFNPKFPTIFPRFVQSAIWRYCAQNGLNVCNGNFINDDNRCDNAHCQIYRSCDRLALRSVNDKNIAYSMS